MGRIPRCVRDALCFAAPSSLSPLPLNSVDFAS
jgi:hypothetical protein